MEKPETGEWKCPQGRFHRNEARLRYGSTVKDCEKVLYRFQGSFSRISEGQRKLNFRNEARPELYLDNCTESDFEKGQLAEEKSSENGVLGSEGDLSNHFNFDLSESKEKERNRLVSGSSDEKIKLQRAQGGCQGTIRRRRTW